MTTLLSGENINYISEQLFNALNANGIDYNIKDNEHNVRNFMGKLSQQWPKEDMTKLNNYALTNLYNSFKQNTASTNSHNVNDQFEQMKASRAYQLENSLQTPPTPDFSKPIIPGAAGANAGLISNRQGGHISLAHARAGGATGTGNPPAPIATRPGRSGQQGQANLDSSDVDLQDNFESSAHLPTTASKPLPIVKMNKVGTIGGTGQEVWISLSKSDLITQSDNSFTFSWNKTVLSEGKSGCLLQLKYVTLPKYFPWLLVQYGSENDESGVFNSTGTSYGAKLLPCHTSGEYTTYQALGNCLQLSKLPNAFGISLTPPSNGLELNSVTVQKITKQNKQIHITTKFHHNLQQTDSLTLEFPHNFTCYKITNLKIINDHQFQIDSPFVGYFNSNFKLLRNNWTLDLTLVCQAI